MPLYRSQYLLYAEMAQMMPILPSARTSSSMKPSAAVVLTAVTQKVHWNSSSIVTLWKSKLVSASLFSRIMLADATQYAAPGSTCGQRPKGLGFRSRVRVRLGLMLMRVDLVHCPQQQPWPGQRAWETELRTSCQRWATAGLKTISRLRLRQIRQASEPDFPHALPASRLVTCWPKARLTVGKGASGLNRPWHELQDGVDCHEQIADSSTSGHRDSVSPNRQQVRAGRKH